MHRRDELLGSYANQRERKRERERELHEFAVKRLNKLSPRKKEYGVARLVCAKYEE